MGASSQYVPSNVTRKADLPSIDYSYVAFAPWISAPCTKAFLAAAHGATAFLTYTPDNGAGTPPAANDESWNLNDGGQWKSQINFPVYVIPGFEGSAIMQELAQYPGTVNNAKDQSILAHERFAPTDYVRLYATFQIKNSSNLPTLWAFLLIVLGIVLLLIGATSFTMHYIQRRRRRALQRRVETGQVDLETLGIKRQRVPVEAIDKLPVITYSPNDEKQCEKQQQDQASELSLEAPKSITRPPNQSSEISSDTQERTNSSQNHSLWAQPTCPICLDDFVPHLTEVRSLPCHHIYHPTCIDPFLRETSSLCPVCKAKVLPSDTGVYNGERITNAMVRRERHVARMRQGTERGHPPIATVDEEQGVNGRLIASLRRGYIAGRRVFSAPTAPEPTTSQMELGTMDPRAASNPISSPSDAIRVQQPPVIPHQNGEMAGRGRRRLNTFLRFERTPDEQEQERFERLPKCK